MSEQYFRLGAKPTDIPYIEAFRQWASGVGMSEAHQQDLIAWGLAQGPNTPPERLADNFYDYCGKRGIEVHDAGLVESWRDHIVETGLPESAPQLATDDDKQRLAEIRADMRGERHSSKYWRDAAVRDEYRSLLERTGIDEPQSGANDPARKVELQELMRTDRAAYFKSGAAGEYQAILARETGEASTQEGTESDTTPLAP